MSGRKFVLIMLLVVITISLTSAALDVKAMVPDYEYQTWSIGSAWDEAGNTRITDTWSGSIWPAVRRYEYSDGRPERTLINLRVFKRNPGSVSGTYYRFSGELPHPWNAHDPLTVTLKSEPYYTCDVTFIFEKKDKVEASEVDGVERTRWNMDYTADVCGATITSSGYMYNYELTYE